MEVKQNHTTDGGRDWYKSLAGYGENDAVECVSLDSGSGHKMMKKTVLRTETVPEKGWASA